MKGKITISRPSFGDGRKLIELQVKDLASRARFVTVQLTYEDFALAVTGLAEIDCELKVQSLDIVGKRRIVEPRETQISGLTYDKCFLSEWLQKNCQEEGWTLDTYLGTQNSVSWDAAAGVTTIRYGVIRYEPSE